MQYFLNYYFFIMWNLTKVTNFQNLIKKINKVVLKAYLCSALKHFQLTFYKKCSCSKKKFIKNIYIRCFKFVACDALDLLFNQDNTLQIFILCLFICLLKNKKYWCFFLPAFISIHKCDYFNTLTPKQL